MWAKLPEIFPLWPLAAAAALLGLLSLFILLIVLVLLRRQRRQWLATQGELEHRLTLLAAADERLERVLREEGARGRDEANAAGKALREEVGGLLRGFQDSVLRTMAEMQTLQKAQLQLFAERLDDGVRRIDQRVEGMAAALKEGMSETRGGLDLRQRDLQQSVESRLTELKGQAAQSDRALREEVQGSLKSLGDGLIASLGRLGESQRERLTQLAEELVRLTQRQEQAQETLRLTVERRLDSLRADNAEKLETIRKTVDEQLQGTLEKRLGESFRLVSERLELVHKGLGEMQSLASGVGDLKRVLSNVKTRGTWGEVQLGSILEQLLTPDQYLTNTPTRPGSAERVEFAIRLPGKIVCLDRHISPCKGGCKYFTHNVWITPFVFLSSQSETLDQFPVSFYVFFLKVIEHISPLPHQFQEPPPGMMILLVGLEVLGQILYSPAEKGDLNLR